MTIEGVDEKGRCWDGWEPVPGKKKGEKGSCRRIESAAEADRRSEFPFQPDGTIAKEDVAEAKAVIERYKKEGKTVSKEMEKAVKTAEKAYAKEADPATNDQVFARFNAKDFSNAGDEDLEEIQRLKNTPQEDWAPEDFEKAERLTTKFSTTEESDKEKDKEAKMPAFLDKKKGNKQKVKEAMTTKTKETEDKKKGEKENMPPFMKKDDKKKEAKKESAEQRVFNTIARALAEATEAGFSMPAVVKQRVRDRVNDLERDDFYITRESGEEFREDELRTTIKAMYEAEESFVKNLSEEVVTDVRKTIYSQLESLRSEVKTAVESSEGVEEADREVLVSMAYSEVVESVLSDKEFEVSKVVANVVEAAMTKKKEMGHDDKKKEETDDMKSKKKEEDMKGEKKKEAGKIPPQFLKGGKKGEEKEEEDKKKKESEKEKKTESEVRESALADLVSSYKVDLGLEKVTD